LAAQTSYTVYALLEDAAGNRSAVTVVQFTTEAESAMASAASPPVIALAMGAGATFTAKTSDGHPLTYKVLTEDDILKTGTVQVGDGTNPAITGGGSGGLTIPETVVQNDITYTVTVIGEKALWGCMGFNGKLTIPESVTLIGRLAFASCNNFSGELTLPTNLTTIGVAAFSGCRGLTRTAIPNKVTNIGAMAFNGCSGLDGALSIPDSVTLIEDNAFKNCSNLNSLTLGAGETIIGVSAFEGCTSLAGRLVVPGTVKSLSSRAFKGCTNLNGVQFQGNKPGIGVSVFDNCAAGFTLQYNADTIGWNGYTYNGSSLVTVIAVQAPTITGPASLSLNAGYSATATDAYTLTGTEPITVEKTSGDSKITWNDTTKKLDIEAGLAAGDYPVALKVSNGVLPDATLNFTLKVNSASYIVSYNANGGSVSPSTMQTGADGKLANLPTPTISGNYTFDGWFTAASGGSAVTANTVFTANTIVYAHWTYYAGGGVGGLKAGENLSGTQVYYGEFDNHPIKWYVVATDAGTATLWTTTSMGIRAYDSGDNHHNWSGSEICTWLNGTESYSSDGFLPRTFGLAEQGAIAAYGSTEQANPANENTSIIDISQNIVLPSVAEMGNWQETGTWNINQSARTLSSDWWLRSPGNKDNEAAFVISDGTVVGGVKSSNGFETRPALKLNLASVLFTSAAADGKPTGIKSSLSEVSPPTGAVKLTILDNDLILSSTDIAPRKVSANDIVSIEYSGATTGENYFVSCLIVDNNGGDNQGKAIYYGKLSQAAAGSTTVRVPNNLASGNYTIKLFNEHCSENYKTDYASNPIEIPMQVDSTWPTIIGITPANNATGISTSGSIVIRFSEAMEPAEGSVSLDGGMTTLPGSWNTPHNTVYTAEYSGLAQDTKYTITIDDFEDVIGNEMDQVTYLFTTKAQPKGPDASPTTLNLDLNGSKTGTITISLGQSGNRADTATIMVEPANTSDIAVDTNSLSSGGTVTVTGLRAVSGAAITVSFSGGDLVAPISIPVTVNIVDSTPVSHSIAVQSDGNGTANANVTSAVSGSAIQLSASPNYNYTFSHWEVTGGAGVVLSNINAANATFAMPDNDITLKAHFRYVGGSTSGGGDSSSGDYSPTLSVTTEKQPNMPTVAKMNVSGTAKDGVLTCTITEQMMKDAIKAAQDAAKKSGKEVDGIAVEFTATGSGTLHSMTAGMEAGAIDRLKEAGAKFIKIGSIVLDVTLDMEAIAEIDRQSIGTVMVSAMRQSKLSKAAKALIGSRPVFDITVSYQKNGKTGYITSFGKGEVTLGIAYKAAANEKTGNLFGVYVDRYGEPQLLSNSSYAGGRLIFGRNSLSTYGVGYKIPAPTFTDTAKHWAKDNIDFVASRGLISGTSATAFAPDTAINRADFLLALGRLSGAEVSGYNASSFTDVNSSDPAMPYIEWAVKNKIVSGYGNGKFGPNDSITREQMAVMMVNYAKATGYTLPVSRQTVIFADDVKISTYAKAAVKAIQQTGVVGGKDNNRFDPQGSATRAEASTILRRFVEVVIDEGTARGWSQNDAGQWQYIDENGKPVIGWLTAENGKYHYYFTQDGIMVSGKWLQIDGKWYYFYTDGSLVKSTKIGDYEVDENGVRKTFIKNWEKAE
jgi:hypothetical protein